MSRTFFGQTVCVSATDLSLHRDSYSYCFKLTSWPRTFPIVTFSKENQNKTAVLTKKENKAKEEAPKQIVQVPTALFFQYNTQLGPPYHVLIDTNFINFSIKNKLEIYKSMMDCLLAKCIPCITDCVMAELEKLGTKYRLALRLAKDPRFERLPCTHSGTYADDCLLQRCQQHRCYIVATCDKELKRKIRKVSAPLGFTFEKHKRMKTAPAHN